MNMAARVIATMRMVVKAEARIIFMGPGWRLFDAAEERIAQSDKNQNVHSANRVKNGDSAQTVRSSPQAGPIVGDKDGVAGIGRIVFDAGGLAGREAVKTNLAFQAGNILRSLIGDSGKRVSRRDGREERRWFR